MKDILGTRPDWNSVVLPVLLEMQSSDSSIKETYPDEQSIRNSMELYYFSKETITDFINDLGCNAFLSGPSGIKKFKQLIVKYSDKPHQMLVLGGEVTEWQKFALRLSNVGVKTTQGNSAYNILFDKQYRRYNFNFPSLTKLEDWEAIIKPALQSIWEVEEFKQDAPYEELIEAVREKYCECKSTDEFVKLLSGYTVFPRFVANILKGLIFEKKEEKQARDLIGNSSIVIIGATIKSVNEDGTMQYALHERTTPSRWAPWSSYARVVAGLCVGGTILNTFKGVVLPTFSDATGTKELALASLLGAFGLAGAEFVTYESQIFGMFLTIEYTALSLCFGKEEGKAAAIVLGVATFVATCFAKRCNDDRLEEQLRGSFV